MFLFTTKIGSLIFFLMQRFCYGLNVFTSKNTNIKRILALIPLFAILIISFLFLNFFNTSLTLFPIFFVLLSLTIFLEVKNFVKEHRMKFGMIIFVILSNLFYGLGTIFYFLGIRKYIEKKYTEI